MIRLAIICFLISMIKSENCNFGIDDVIKLRQLFHDSERRMEEGTRGQSGNAAIVIGAQSSGEKKENEKKRNYNIGNETISQEFSGWEKKRGAERERKRATMEMEGKIGIQYSQIGSRYIRTETRTVERNKTSFF
ncbi:uncharacterized protein LOC122504677 [Leptopilina heterotoma]|uniref:uncharacterized protein LOC122504677 n=1 Tax=Leptopilina heterotoma TaxID=63436 RepID=UPI001CA7F6C0|nr:uncharacterized protein LOC122504677 [Leptopilina heterotoma]